jgi:hypothetical protein
MRGRFAGPERDEDEPAVDDNTEIPVEIATADPAQRAGTERPAASVYVQSFEAYSLRRNPSQLELLSFGWKKGHQLLHGTGAEERSYLVSKPGDGWMLSRSDTYAVTATLGLVASIASFGEAPSL